MNITKNNVISINYTLKDDAGEILDTSEGKDPLVYIHGLGHIIVGLEEALEGKTKGEKVQASIPPDKAYGPRNDKMQQTLPRSEFKDVPDLATGMQFQVDTGKGAMILTVMEIKDKEVIVDGNHPLAGLTLHFDVEILEIREATEEELSHGHVHGEGGHHH